MDPLIIVGVIIFIIIFSVAGPACLIWSFVLIWALNTFFALAIPYTFGTWLAGIVIIFIAGGHFNRGKG